MYYAVDKRGRGFLFKEKPQRCFGCCWYDSLKDSQLDRLEVFENNFLKESLPTLTWEDEPIEIFLNTTK